MTIPEDMIENYLRVVFGQSEPGAILHNLLVAAAKPADVGPLGLVDPDNLHVTMSAIAPDASVDAERYIAQVITHARTEAQQCGQVIYFAALVVESVKVTIVEGDKEGRDLARRMKAEGRLHEHPNFAEASRLYAACRDGRRWVGDHYLTGPLAGTIVGPDLRTGALAADERSPHRYLIRLITGSGVAES